MTSFPEVTLAFHPSYVGYKFEFFYTRLKFGTKCLNRISVSSDIMQLKILTFTTINAGHYLLGYLVSSMEKCSSRFEFPELFLHEETRPHPGSSTHLTHMTNIENRELKKAKVRATRIVTVRWSVR